jgi:hypothetical protein
MTSKVREFKKKVQEKVRAGYPVEVKLGTLIDSLPALNQLALQPLPAKVTFQIGKLLKAVYAEVEVYENARTSACQQHGELNKETNRYDIRETEKAEFDKQITELRGVNVKMNFSPLKIESLDGATLSGAAMLALDWLIIE